MDLRLSVVVFRYYDRKRKTEHDPVDAQSAHHSWILGTESQTYCSDGAAQIGSSLKSQKIRRRFSPKLLHHNALTVFSLPERIDHSRIVLIRGDE